jgi:hypothetical protein
MYSTTLCRSKSDTVRDLEDVVQVVGDHHHRQPAVAEPHDQVKH